VVVENHGDAPFFATCVPPETVAGMAVVARAVRDALRAGGLVGANVLRNDAHAALAVAAAADLDFVRVNVLAGVFATDQGLVEGDAARVLRARARLAPRVRILADVRVKHAAPLAPRPVAEEARDLVARSGADALIVTGPRTGSPPDTDELRRVREAVPEALLLVGSGATAANAAGLLRIADGVIVGTSVKRGGRWDASVDVARARAFARAAR
jgi:membrane complex biogenesis BtpA family protein